MIFKITRCSDQVPKPHTLGKGRVKWLEHGASQHGLAPWSPSGGSIEKGSLSLWYRWCLRNREPSSLQVWLLAEWSIGSEGSHGVAGSCWLLDFVSHAEGVKKLKFINIFYLGGVVVRIFNCVFLAHIKK